uniref:Uncharacterized protein n=1 Tax=Terrapene triunguis TaxID=2587831 RepID=A0A674ISC0_9SAUR
MKSVLSMTCVMALDFLAGCVGGAAGVLVGHPFDTVKVRLQVQSVEKPLYRGTYHCFQSIIKHESAFGLYKGIGSPMMGLTFINALVSNTSTIIESAFPLSHKILLKYC